MPFSPAFDHVSAQRPPAARAAIYRPGEAVYRSVKRRIVLNELGPGVSITELGLARELGCSQGTVREALFRLREDGLVQRTPNRGTLVTPIGPEEAAEIVALRRRIETMAAPKAAAAAGAQDVLNLRRLYDAMADAAERGDDYGLIEIDTEFHLAIFRLARLQALEQILRRCILHSHRSKLWAPGHRRSLADTAGRHAGILERLAAGDGAGLADSIAAHIDTIVDTTDRTR
jgi:DNA-binding GntR family transcriptional regulator